MIEILRFSFSGKYVRGKQTYSLFNKTLNKSSIVWAFLSFILPLFIYSASYAQSYQMIGVSGFNQDLVADGSSGPASNSTTTAMDAQGTVMYVKGYQGCVGYLQYGLPQNGFITSASNGALTYQMAPFNTKNALFLKSGENGALTFNTSGSYDIISILATSSEGSSSFSAILNFSDGSSTSYSFNVPDWYNGYPYSFAGFGRVSRLYCNSDESAGNPRFYDNVITLNSADKQKLLKSVSFHSNGYGYTSIYAITGRTVVNSPAAPLNPYVDNITSNGFKANWTSVSNATSYVLDVSTDPNFNTFFGGFNNYNVGNTLSYPISAPIGTYYFRVRAVNSAGQSLSSSTVTAVVKNFDTNPPIIVAQNVTVNLNSSGSASIATAPTLSDVFLENFSEETDRLANTLTNWDFAQAGMTVDVGDYTPNNGIKEIDLAGNSNAKITTKKSFLLVPGQYQISFNNQLNSNPAGGNSVQVTIGSLFNQNFVSYSNATTETATFTVSTPTLVPITFEEYGPNDAAGSFISNIRLSRVINPSFSVFVNATDDSGVDGVTVSKSTFDCSNVGANPITLTVKDVYWNTTVKNVTVTVVDNILPVITLNGNSSITQAAYTPYTDLGATATDNCSAIVTVDNPVNVNAPGTYTVTYTAKDPSGNTTTAQRTVIVQDTVSPIVKAKDVVVYLNQSGSASITPQTIDNGSSDNSGSVSLSVDRSAFDCSDLDAKSVATIVSDASWKQSTYNTSTPQPYVSVISQLPAASTYTLAANVQDPYGQANFFQPPVPGASPIRSFSGLKFFRNEFVLTGRPESLRLRARVDNVMEIFINGVSVGIEGNFDTKNFNNTVYHDLYIDETGVHNGYQGGMQFDQVTSQSILDLLHEGSNEIVFAIGNDNIATDDGGFMVRMDAVAAGVPVVLTATDPSGNKSNTTAFVVVKDNIAPTIVSKPLSVVLTADGTVSITPQDVLQSGTDNCSGTITYSLDKSTFGASDAVNSPVTVNLTGTDASGNATTVPVQVTVVDPVPTVITKNITVALNASGTATITPQDVDNGSSSVVGLSGLSLDKTTFDCSNIGDNTITLTATSTLGKSASATAIVTIIDTIAPTVLTKDITVQLDAQGKASITPADIDAGSTDNCAIASESLSQTQFDCDAVKGQSGALKFDGVDDRVVAGSSVGFSQGSAGRTVEMWIKTTQATAALFSYGNFAYHQRSALYISGGRLYYVGEYNDAAGGPTLVNDGQWHHVAYTLVGQTLKFYIDGQLNYTTNTPYVPATSGTSWALSNTSQVSYTREPFNGAMSEVRVWNTVRTDAQIAANYNKALTGNEAGLVAYYNFDTGSGGILFDKTANHNNGTLTNMNVAQAWVAGAPAVSGANTVTLTVTDTHGNISTGTAKVTVEDKIAPTVLTKNATVQLDASGKASITVADINNGSYDNCAVQSLTLDKTNFDCSNVGANIVTLTVTDVHGNVSTGTATVTVEDKIAPTVLTKDVTVQLNASGQATITTADINNGSYDNCGIQSLSLDKTAFDCSNYGTNTVTLTVTDVHGNVSTGTATVTVEDKISPIVLTKNVTVQLDANGQSTITAADINNGSSDNCAIASISVDETAFDCSNYGANTVTLTVTDVHGNVSTGTAIVTVEDKVAPTVLTKNITVQLNAQGQASITASNIDAGSTDNCAIGSYKLSKTAFDCDNYGANTVTLTVTDVHGNASSGTATVTVQDTIAPIVLTKNVIVALNSSGQGSITTSDIDAGSTDNCGIANIQLDKTTFDCDNYGANTVILTVTDIHGNVATRTATVNVIDKIAPTITAPLSQEICFNASNNYSIPVLLSSDNCAVGSTSYVLSGATTRSGDSNDASGLFNTGVTTITWTVTDIHGNVSTASNEITIWPLPVVSLTPSTPDEFCNAVTLTPSSTIPVVSYNWMHNNVTFSTNADLHLSIADEDGTYELYVTDIHGCVNTQIASYTYNKQSSASSYTILGIRGVKLGENNNVQTGSVGAMGSKGKVEIKKSSSVAATGAFVKANSIKVDKNATVPAQIQSPVTADLPTMEYFSGYTKNLPKYEAKSNTTLTGNYSNLTIEEGVSVTLTGSLFGNIKVEDGATVTFTSPVINIMDLNIDGSSQKVDSHHPSVPYTTIKFSSDAVVKVSDKVDVEGHSIINPDGHKVIFFVGSIKDHGKGKGPHDEGDSCPSYKQGDDHRSRDNDRDDEDDDYYGKGQFKVNGGDVYVTASVYVPEGKIMVNGGEKATSYLTGMFIGEYVQSDTKNVVWNGFNCQSNQNGNTPQVLTTNGSTNVLDNPSGITLGVSKLIAYPNPFSLETTVSFSIPYNDSHVKLEMFDLRGERIEGLYNAAATADQNYEVKFNGGHIAAGTYFFRLTTSKEVKNFKVIMK